MNSILVTAMKAICTSYTPSRTEVTPSAKSRLLWLLDVSLVPLKHVDPDWAMAAEVRQPELPRLVAAGLATTTRLSDSIGRLG